MRVLFLTYHLPVPSEPGSGRPWGEVQILRNLGHDVVVITAGTQYLTGEARPTSGWRPWTREVHDGLEIVRTRAPAGHRRSNRARMINYIAYAVVGCLAAVTRGRCDVVLTATDPVTILPVGALAAIWHRAALVLDERDLIVEVVAAVGLVRQRPLLALLQRMQAIVRARAAAILVVSPTMRSVLRAYGVPSDKVFLLPNAFSHDHHAAAARVRPHPTTGFRVLFAGGMGQATDIPTILSAAEELLRQGRADIRFEFVGAGERKDGYAREASQRALTNCIFLPPVPREQVCDLYRRSDAAVHAFPDLPIWNHALSTKIFDYLFHGLPVVFAGRGDIPDLLSRSGGGLSVPPTQPQALAAAIASLADHPSTAATMGNNGQAYVQQHFGSAALRQTVARSLERATGQPSVPEIERLRRAYQHYDTTPSERAKRDPHNAGNRLIVAEREQAMRSLLDQARLVPLNGRTVLDVGCGSGTLLNWFKQFGACSEQLWGIDLLPDRIFAAARVDPRMHLICGELTQQHLPAAFFDLVCFSTVISSILDRRLAGEVCREAIRVLKPGGYVLWYDFRFNNPWNRETRGIERSEIERLFPECRVQLQTLTVVPPLARRLGRLTRPGYPLLARIGPLRTHYLGLLEKQTA